MLATRSELQYPIDGVVGIEDGHMNIIKLKDTKSVELKLQENGALTSSEGKAVIESNLQNSYTPGSIIEVRFSKDSSADRPRIESTLLRTDKTTANAYDVCRDIFNTATQMPDALSRRRTLTWCNAVRRHIHKLAASAPSKARVIMDVGSGDGQAISDLILESNVRYLLLEPDSGKCDKLMKRLNGSGQSRCKLFRGAISFAKAMQSAATGSVNHSILCASIEEIIEQPHFGKILRDTVRSCVASFSISHVHASMLKLALLNIDAIGCGYMYDSANSEGVLVGEAGVKMSVTEAGVAKVKWGKDTAYMEPAITKADFKEMFYVKLATDAVPISNDDKCPLLASISRSLYIVSTRRHV